MDENQQGDGKAVCGCPGQLPCGGYLRIPGLQACKQALGKEWVRLCLLFQFLFSQTDQ